ncbi:chromogranin-A [Callorhinchus milii]|uniref:chromogranin-A n=1 Tax=Callorhinchus milii TaxID=7868 RepID=UPI001C3FB99E|nr:chromogranin-A [Callorhinchus milii]
MIARGIFTFLLFTCTALSSPVPNVHSKADAKVMKCIVEVISDILSKPSPLPISEECMEALRKDERIISVLRHQDLLKELQELATEGVSEKALEEKQTKDYMEELYAAKSQVDKKISADESSDSPGEHWQGPTSEATERKVVEDDVQDEKDVTQSSTETMESNLNGGVSADRNGPSTESISDIISKLTQRERKRLAKDKLMKLNLRENESSEEMSPDHDEKQVGEEQEPEQDEDRETQRKETIEVRPAKSSEKYEEEVTTEELTNNDDEQEEEEEEEDKPVEESKEDGSQSVLRRHGSNRDRSEAEQDRDLSVEELQANDNSRSDPELEDEELREDDNLNQQKKSEEKESGLSEEWEENKRWSKMDELTRELNSNKRDEVSEEKSDQSMLAERQRSAESRTPKAHNKYSKFRNSWEEAMYQPSENSQERRYNRFLKLHKNEKRPEMEEKKDEEGSASRRNEEQELESLAQIENELEDVAWKLHEIRQRY